MLLTLDEKRVISLTIFQFFMCTKVMNGHFVGRLPDSRAIMGGDKGGWDGFGDDRKGGHLPGRLSEGVAGGGNSPKPLNPSNPYPCKLASQFQFEHRGARNHLRNCDRRRRLTRSQTQSLLSGMKRW